MSEEFYLSEPDVHDYYLSLPESVRRQINQRDLEISTLGELKMWVEHYIAANSVPPEEYRPEP